MEGLHGWQKTKFTRFMDGKLFGLCSDTTDPNRNFTGKGGHFEILQREISEKQSVVKRCGSVAAAKRGGIPFQQFSV